MVVRKSGKLVRKKLKIVVSRSRFLRLRFKVAQNLLKVLEIRRKKAFKFQVVEG